MRIKKIKEKYNTLSIPVKAALWYTICNIINKGIALMSTPIFTRLLTEEQYGTFAIFQSWYNILIIFTSLNIFQSGYTKGLILFKNDVEGFTSSQLSLTTTITIITGLIYLADIDFWTNIFDLPFILMCAMFLELLVMPALEFWSAKKRFDFCYKEYVIVTLCMSSVSLFGGIIAVYFSKYKIEARVFTDVLAKAFFAGILFTIIFVKGKTFYRKQYWKYALKFNLPLIPHYLSTYVLSQSDRLMIGRMVGKREAAFYSVAYTISTMMLLVTSAVNNSLTPYVYKSIEKNESGKIISATKPIFYFVAALSILSMAFAPEIIYIFAGKNYMDAVYVIPPIAAAVYFIFVYSMFSMIEYYFEETTFIAIATLASALINLILNYFVIGKFGYYAAGYTTLVCYICLSAIHYIFYKIVINKHLNNHKDIFDIKTIIYSSIGTIVIMFGMVFTYKYFFVRYSIIIGLGIVGYIKRKEILSVLKDIKR